jgi:cytokinesis protein
MRVQGAKKLSEAGQALLNAKFFKELLSVSPSIALANHRLKLLRSKLILLIGNYMNGTGIKGGAFGFRVSSINKVG